MVKSITEEQYKKLIWKEKLSYVKEWKCKCNECGKTWHYLASDKFSQDTGELGKDLIQSTACCCNPFGILIGGLRQKQKDFNQCPNCNSKNVKKQKLYYKKET